MNKYFNTQVVYSQQPVGIDRQNGIITGVVVVQTGEAKGHNLQIDDSFIEKVEMLGNESKAGIKARFGHPNICSTALGTYLGRYRNFRRSAGKVMADLHLDLSAARSPKGNLYDYILTLAETNPDMFGASIAFNAGDEIIRKVNDNGTEKELRFAVINSLYAIDFVDNPAVTDGLFATIHEDDFAFQVTTFLDEHPEIFTLIDSKPHILQEFLTRYKTFKETKPMNLKDEITTLKNWVTSNFSTKPNPEPSVNSEPKTENPSANSEPKTENSFQTLEQTVSQLTTRILELETLNSQLETRLNKSLAFPTLPDKQADPLLSTATNHETDFTGREILKHIPSTARRKLKLQTANS